jgi:hypothetical protein
MFSCGVNVDVRIFSSKDWDIKAEIILIRLIFCKKQSMLNTVFMQVDKYVHKSFQTTNLTQ